MKTSIFILVALSSACASLPRDARTDARPVLVAERHDTPMPVECRDALTAAAVKRGQAREEPSRAGTHDYQGGNTRTFVSASCTEYEIEGALQIQVKQQWDDV